MTDADLIREAREWPAGTYAERQLWDALAAALEERGKELAAERVFTKSYRAHRAELESSLARLQAECDAMKAVISQQAEESFRLAKVARVCAQMCNGAIGDVSREVKETALLTIGNDLDAAIARTAPAQEGNDG